MSRIDKYDSKDGGFRAPMGFALPAGDIGLAIGVGLDANGRLVRGSGNTGVKGVLVLTQVKAVGDIVDTMTDGELVEFPGVAGTNYYSDAAGAISSAATTTAGTVTTPSTYVGHTVEGTRLIARVAR